MCSVYHRSGKNVAEAYVGTLFLFADCQIVLPLCARKVCRRANNREVASEAVSRSEERRVRPSPQLFGFTMVEAAWRVISALLSRAANHFGTKRQNFLATGTLSRAHCC